MRRLGGVTGVDPPPRGAAEPPTNRRAWRHGVRRHDWPGACALVVGALSRFVGYRCRRRRRWRCSLDLEGTTRRDQPSETGEPSRRTQRISCVLLYRRTRERPPRARARARAPRPSETSRVVAGAFSSDRQRYSRASIPRVGFGFALVSIGFKNLRTVGVRTRRMTLFMRIRNFRCD